MTQAFNLSQLANFVNTSGQLNAATGLYNQTPVANGGTGLSSVTSGAVLVGAGTSAMTVLAGTTPGTVIGSSPTGWSAVPNTSVGGGNYIMRTLTSPSPWTKPAALKSIKVTVLGAGGAGGPASRPGPPSGPGQGGGGGSGGFSIAYFDAPAIPGPLTVSVGTGTSSFGPLVSCTAGAAGGPGVGSNVTGAGGSGGIATGGAIALNGFTGAPGNTSPGQTTVGTARSGANSWFLGIGAYAPPAVDINGAAGTGYGAGGSGASGTTPNTPRTGGAGAPGIVIIEEFY